MATVNPERFYGAMSVEATDVALQKDGAPGAPERFHGAMPIERHGTPQKEKEGEERMTEIRISTRQLAERLGLTPGTVRMWRVKGGGPKYLRIAQNRAVYRLADVEAWEAERLYANTSEETASRGKAA